MIWKVRKLWVEISEKDGRLLSVKNEKREFLANIDRQPLFTVCFLDEKGVQTRISSDTAREIRCETGEAALCLQFKGVGGLDFDAQVRMCAREDGLHITMAFDNGTAEIVEWVELAALNIPRDLRLNGGESVYFSPIAEGGLIEDIELREKFMGTRYKDITFGRDGGLTGLYPRTAQMQFMAYYGPHGGLYFGAHDEQCHTKTLELRPGEWWMTLEHRLFPGAVRGAFSMEYDVVLSGFDGDWYDAAEIYRDWFEKSAIRPVPIGENPAQPAWLEDSPVILIYPVRGVKDYGDMTPNCYYPFEKGVEYVNRIAEKLGCRVMALMMHWEGTAPWAPPFVWPPFGGEAGFARAVKALHEKGNLVGVYCSGIGWTTESVLEPGYRPGMEQRGIRVEDIAVRGPGNSLAPSTSLPTIRKSYDVCPYPPCVEAYVADEVEKIARSGVDYCQYFDQNWNGNSRFCYGSNHGHPSAAGRWQKDAMLRIQKKANERIRTVGSRMVLGTEGAAAEPFIGQLPFNDLRFIKWYYHGVPVPAYSWLTHEYTTNFSGNSCGVTHALDIHGNPSNAAFTMAYAFVAGNILSVVLGPEGKFHWGWCVDWAEGSPENQEELWRFTAHLNAWRRGAGKPFLYGGRMEKPEPLEGIKNYRLLRPDGSCAQFPELLHSRWSREGRTAQFVVNFHDSEKSFCVAKETLVYSDPEKEGIRTTAEEKIMLAPFSACMLEF